LLGFSLFALTFDLVKVQDDGTIYFDYLRRVFGVNTGGVAYQVGSAFWMAPFWLVSQAVAAARTVGVRLAGVDLIAADIGSPEATIIEVNGTPGLHYHYQVADPANATRVVVPVLRRLLDG